MKDINTITEDIYHVLDATQDHEHDATLVEGYASRIGGELHKATAPRNKPRTRGSLWASDLGKKCLRAHWYNFNGNSTVEKLEGHTKFKFLYGNLLEEAVLYFAEEAGHAVSHAQGRVEWQVNEDWQVTGRIDAVIDGKLVDVKTTSTYGFKRYKDGITPSNDSFGYLEQVGFYTHFNGFDVPIDGTGFLWVDKGNGHIKYTEVVPPTKDELEQRANNIIQAVDKEEHEVVRFYKPEPYGKSGNMSLPISCSYCPHKQTCWRDSNNGQGLRGFAYNHAPVWFTDVQREPRCPELPRGVT